MAALCVGVPLFFGYFVGEVADGILASMSGLIILYIPFTPIVNRMGTLMICSFGFIVSFTVGLFFSFNPVIASLILGIFSFSMYGLITYLRIKPPGYFFFILIIAVAICMPYDPQNIPRKIGIIAMGTISTCTLALIYSLLTLKKYPSQAEIVFVAKNKTFHILEASIVGFCIGLSLIIAHILHLENPYWVPVSCAAVMQGATSKHIWQRSIHRILGTFIGIGFAGLLLDRHMSALAMCISIIVLQFIVEMLVTRNYGFAVIFITALTIFMAEGGHTIGSKPHISVYARFLDITIGSTIGAIGGWFLYHQKLRRNVYKQVIKTKRLVSRETKTKIEKLKHHN